MIYYDSPYYLNPTDKVGEEAYAVIREAMRHKGVVGISRVVLFRRERAVMLEPRGDGIVLWTLRYGDEVRDAEAYFEDIDRKKADSKLLKKIEKLIDDHSREWDPRWCASGPGESEGADRGSQEAQGWRYPPLRRRRQRTAATSSI